MMLNYLYSFPTVLGTESGDVFTFKGLFKQESAYLIIFSY